MKKVTAADKAYWKRVAKANAILEDEARAEAAKRLPGDKILRALDLSAFANGFQPRDARSLDAQRRMQDEKSAAKANFYVVWRKLQRKRRRRT